MTETVRVISTCCTVSVAAAAAAIAVEAAAAVAAAIVAAAVCFRFHNCTNSDEKRFEVYFFLEKTTVLTIIGTLDRYHTYFLSFVYL